MESVNSALKLISQALEKLSELGYDDKDELVVKLKDAVDQLSDNK
jgi:hypothetical protein